MTKLIRNAALGLLLAGLANIASAASLGLSPTWPDLVVFDANYDYVYNTSGNPSTHGGTLTITDTGMMALNPDGSGNIGISGGSYELIANFDVDGLFLGGTVSALGTTLDPDFMSGTLVTGDLLDFGFSGIDQAGSIEFTFDNVGGDMAAFSNLGGVIISLNDMVNGFGAYSGIWDEFETNDPAFWQRNFGGTANVDTFVPVPAAVWLFASGLVGLGISARRKKK